MKGKSPTLDFPCNSLPSLCQEIFAAGLEPLTVHLRVTNSPAGVTLGESIITLFGCTANKTELMAELLNLE